MKIEFELSDIQATALDELMGLAGPQLKAKDANDVAKEVLLRFIIQNKQQLIAKEIMGK